VNKWDPALQAHCTSLGKPVVVTGDLNVSHRDLDIYNYFAPHVPKQAGCTPQEREAFGSWLDSGFVDAFAHLHPTVRGHYTYWTQRTGARQVNKGLRLDYFVLSKQMAEGVEPRDGTEPSVDQGKPQPGGPKLHDCYVLNETTQGVSDHAPIVLQLAL